MKDRLRTVHQEDRLQDVLVSVAALRKPEALKLQQSRAASCYPGSPEDGVMWCEKWSASGRAVASVMWLAVVRVW